jgi:ParB-like chromosome segregation protein Spo0J
MENFVRSIALERLISHPDNPNRQSKATFARLVSNIKRTGKYEPLIVHRCRALAELGYDKAEVIVWDVDDEQTDVLLATLNRLCGNDILDKKATLLKRLNEKLSAKDLSKLLPQTKKQIERLVNLRIPDEPTKISADSFATPLVFFVSQTQKQKIERALVQAEQNDKGTRAARRAAALTLLADYFVNHNHSEITAGES